MSDKKGYSKEKADKLIKQHEDKAKEFERKAQESSQYETFQRSSSEDYRAQARRERQKADNLRELKKQWGDK